MKRERAVYEDLNSRQQENYNFQKLAGVLAEFGYNCIRLSDDWEGADFLALHNDGTTTLRVQLKGRLRINKKYQNKEVYIAFPDRGKWYLAPHDELVKTIGEVKANALLSKSWEEGHYSVEPLPKILQETLSRYALENPESCPFGTWGDTKPV